MVEMLLANGAFQFIVSGEGELGPGFHGDTKAPAVINAPHPETLLFSGTVGRL